MLSQSIIRIIMSAEKYKFIEEKDDYNYEIDILKTIITKCIRFYYDKFGEQYNNLFRREEIFDDLIKHVLVIYGNNMFINCFVNPINKIQKYFDIDDVDKFSYLTLDEFNNFYIEFLDNIKIYIPDVIKIFLHLLHNSIIDIYKIEKQNYKPILTLLFFSYFTSPRYQDIYGLSPINNILIRNINKIIRVSTHQIVLLPFIYIYIISN